MSIFLIIILAVAALYLLITGVYCACIAFAADQNLQRRDRTIAVLIAARNEESGILHTLQSVAEMDYPQDKTEVWIGDDDSEDRTAEMVQEFIKGRQGWHYVKITEEFPCIHGKQNVLAHLAQRTQAELLLITDADIRVGKNWAASLAGAIERDTAMVSGPTIVSGEGVFAAMQRLDWLMGITAARAHSTLGIPITAVGNNLGVTLAAYRQAGGYENIPFSITEDYKLYQVICEKGPHRFRQLFHANAMNISAPVTTISRWLHQRKRWFRGGAELPLHNKAFLIFNGMVMPLFLSSLFFVPLKWFLICYGTKIAGDFLLLLLASARLKKTEWILWFPLYELYYQIMTIVIPVNQMLPTKIIWKGRRVG